MKMLWAKENQIMRPNAKHAITALIIVFSFIGVSCELDVPINEMGLAKMTISRGAEVKAEKYAPDELKKAREHLLLSHEDLKKEETGDAKENARKALDYARKAVEKSLPLLSKDTLDEAQKLHGEVEKLFAEKYAPQEFNESTRNLNEANSLHTEGKYWDAYLKSTAAIQNDTVAKTKSLPHLSEIKSNIERMKKEVESLKAMKGDTFASNELNSALSLLGNAETEANAMNAKGAQEKIDEARKKLESATQKTQKGVAGEKIEEAESALAETKKSRLQDLYSSEIQKASTRIAESKKLYDSQSYKDSIAQSDEAITILKGVNTALLTKEEELKKRANNQIESAENSLKKIQESEIKDSYKDDIEKAIPLISRSKELYSEESYQGSIAASDEALKILTAITIAMEKRAEEARLSKEGDKGGEYVVKLNPQKRDCLWRIAFYVYKDARLWPLIYTANRNKIKDPDLIYPGQRFLIPPVPSKEKKEDASKDDSAVLEDKERDTPSE